MINEIDRLVSEFDLETYLDEKGFRQLNEHEWVGDCPQCLKPKVAVNTDRRMWHCWVCQEFEDYFDAARGEWRRRAVTGAGGVIRLIRWLEECEFQEALQLIGSKPIWSLQNTQAINSELATEILDTDLTVPAIPPPENWAPITSTLPYLEQRGITMEDVAAFGLFWCPQGKYANRVVFPVWEDQKLVYWQARAMFEEAQCPPGRKFIKSLNPKRMPGYAVSSELIGNLEQASLYPRVALTEGPIDAIHVGRDAGWTFGKQLTPQQIARLLRRGVKAIDLMWDGPTPREPEGAHPEMVRLAPQLAAFFDVRLVFLPHGDPGDWPRQALQELRQAAVPFDLLSRTARL